MAPSGTETPCPAATGPRTLSVARSPAAANAAWYMGSDEAAAAAAAAPSLTPTPPATAVPFALVHGVLQFIHTGRMTEWAGCVPYPVWAPRRASPATLCIRPPKPQPALGPARAGMRAGPEPLAPAALSRPLEPCSRSSCRAPLAAAAHHSAVSGAREVPCVSSCRSSVVGGGTAAAVEPPSPLSDRQ